MLGDDETRGRDISTDGVAAAVVAWQVVIFFTSSVNEKFESKSGIGLWRAMSDKGHGGVPKAF